MFIDRAGQSVRSLCARFRSKAAAQRRGSLFVDAALSISIFVTAMCLLLSALLQLGREAEAVLDMYKVQDYGNVALSYFGQPVEHPLVLYGEGHSLVYRPFCGEPPGKGEERVYIFPKRGERYHYPGCSTLKSGDSITLLTSELKRKYSPCKLCKPESLPYGARVCIYGAKSKTYHRTSCATVSKSYECIKTSEAIERGYSECKLCSPSSEADYAFLGD